MAHTAYLTINGETQGLISSGCNTQDSMGNKCQLSHVDEITVLSTEYSMTKSAGGAGSNNAPVVITKCIDKASPLIAAAFSRQEPMDCTIKFYRTNDRGGNENYYTIDLKKALIVSCDFSQPHTVSSHKEDMHETVSFTYRDIIWNHNIAGTMGYATWENNEDT